MDKSQRTQMQSSPENMHLYAYIILSTHTCTQLDIIPCISMHYHFNSLSIFLVWQFTSHFRKLHLPVLPRHSSYPHCIPRVNLTIKQSQRGFSVIWRQPTTGPYGKLSWVREDGGLVKKFKGGKGMVSRGDGSESSSKGKSKAEGKSLKLRVDKTRGMRAWHLKVG